MDNYIKAIILCLNQPSTLTTPHTIPHTSDTRQTGAFKAIGEGVRVKLQKKYCEECVNYNAKKELEKLYIQLFFH